MKIITHLKEEIQKNGGCIEFILTIPYWFNIEERSDRVLEGIRRSTAMVIIYLGNERDLYLFSLILVHHLDSLPASIWIFTDELILKIWYHYNTFPLNGSLAFVNHKKEVPGLRDFFSVVNPERYPGDMFLKDVWFLSFWCNVPGTPTFLAFPNCTGTENLKDTEDIMRFQATAPLYNIYNAVYAVAHALHAAIFSPPGKKGTQGEKQLQEFNPWMFNQHLKKVHFTNTAGEEVFFDENGDSTMGFDLLNWVYTGNKSHHAVLVGRFDPLTTEGEKLTLNESLITWNTGFKQTPPKSRCSKPCPVGYRKLISESKPICCYTCIQCPEGEISNHSDADHCLPCPEHEWPNVRRDTCIPKDVVFLSYTEPLGVALAFIASSCSVSTALVLWMFIKFRDTPVVKANNRDLSYVLLLSLTLCFLCSLLFIGHPQKVSCVLRQAVFGITFTLSVSSILGKTLTVVMAFHAIKPGSKLMKWVRYRVANYLVVLCSLIQAMICIIWLSAAPPFPSYDAHSVIGQVILECNEGSFIAFYRVLGYIGFLATICFVIAFLARKLPDSFNESKFITFSMLVFCSVWISFIPAYLSTKGKYMVAVEIFAILASGAGLLGCIFIPKCYVIILRPEMNTKGQLVRT